MFVIHEGWQGRDGRDRYLRSSVNRTLGPWSEFEFAELAKIRLELKLLTKPFDWGFGGGGGSK
jgi:hypothetical protein